MRNLTIALFAISVVLLVVCVALFSKTRRDARVMTTMQMSADSTRAGYTRTLAEIAAVQDSLAAIAMDEGGLMPISAFTENGQIVPDSALARLAALKADVRQTRERIAMLESRLAKGNDENSGLRKVVNQLKTELAEKEERVAALGARVDSLRMNVADLTMVITDANTRIAAQSDTLEQRRRELGTVYVASGTRRDLIAGGVVVARGGLLGMGRTLGPTNTADPSRFRAVDTDQDSVITLEGTKAQVLTAQPAQSYTIEAVNGKLELRILDAAAFRKVKRLVIVTA